MNCNILESLMLLLLFLLACVVVARLLWGCCRRQARTEMPIYCLLPAYCPRDNRELKSRRAAEKSQHIQQQYNNNNTSCKLMCRGGTKNTNQMQTHAAPKFTVTTTNTTVESTQSWCLGDFYFYPKPRSCSCARFSSVDRHRLSNGRNEETTTTTTTQATSTTIVQWIYA